MRLFFFITIALRVVLIREFTEGIKLAFVAFFYFSSFPFFKLKMFFKEFSVLIFALCVINGALSLPVETIESPHDKWERQPSAEDSN